MTKDHDFSFGGKTYQIRVSRIGEKFEVRAFLDGKPANPYIRAIDLDMATGFMQHTGKNPLESFVEEAKTDIKEERWEKLQAILKNPPKLP